MARSDRANKKESSVVETPTQKGEQLACAPVEEEESAGGQAPMVAADPARAITEALAGRFTPQVLCDKLQELMGFSKTYMNRKGEVLSSPEGSVQLKAVETIIAYLVGRPVERQQVISMSAPATMDDLLEKARQSPVFRSTLRQLLDGLDEVEKAA